MEGYLSIPKLGESVSEATIIKWLVKEGDIIEKDQAFVEVATDKVESEIPSPYKCKVLKILKQIEDSVDVEVPIAAVEWLEEVNIEDDFSPSESITKSQVQKPSAQSKKDVEYSNVLLSPLVKKIFHKNNISLADIQFIKGTGHEGRITRDDALKYIANRSKILEDAPFVVDKKDFKRNVENADISSGDEVVHFDRMQALTAANMLKSKQQSAHCTTVIDIDVTTLVEWRDRVKETFYNQHNLKLTYTHIFMKLVAASLLKFPKLNAYQYDDGLVLKKDINLGFATSYSDDRLIVPVVKKIDDMDLVDIVKKVSELAHKAMDNTLDSQDIQGGTFTQSNTGIFGSLLGTPIIHQPQVAIMSLGEIQRVPAVIIKDKKETIEIRSKMMASLSYDHRVINGAYASQFLSDYRQRIFDFIDLNF